MEEIQFLKQEIVQLKDHGPENDIAKWKGLGKDIEPFLHLVS